jgi:hypothetical protein
MNERKKTRNINKYIVLYFYCTLNSVPEHSLIPDESCPGLSQVRNMHKKSPSAQILRTRAAQNETSKDAEPLQWTDRQAGRPL